MIRVVIGTQFGDEGKGKIIDYLSRDSDFVVRYHGGAGAGHTVVNNLGTFKMHLVPCGIFNKNTRCVIANGVMVDPPVLLEEINALSKARLNLSKRLFISGRAHVVFPYHKILDGIFDEAKGELKTATTRRGNGPVHADKVSYYGILLQEVLDKELLKQKLSIILKVKNKIIKEFGGNPVSLNETVNSYYKDCLKLKKYIADTYEILNEAVRFKKNILFEGAHGIFLDNDWGTYPYVTASSILPSNIGAGAGIDPRKINEVIGVVKAYSTMVDSGARPFPSEIGGKIGEAIRGWGGEFGTTTGRPRRIGWLDLIQLKFAVKLAGITYLALTKADVLSGLKSINVCVGYKLNGKKVDYLNLNSEQLKKVTPVLKEFLGWDDIAECKSFESLPKEFKAYISFIEKFVGIPVKIISVGPDREQTILKNRL